MQSIWARAYYVVSAQEMLAIIALDIISHMTTNSSLNLLMLIMGRKVLLDNNIVTHVSPASFSRDLRDHRDIN